ncbi:MAG: aminodeoxychorismate synthase, component I, partial [Desulfotignum sp.]
MGYVAYDLKDQIENLPKTCVDTGLPDICLYAPSMILVHDRILHKTTLCIPILENTGYDLSPQAYVSRLKQTLWDDIPAAHADKGFCIDARGLVSRFTKHEYLDAVTKIIQYLRAGDIYQANLSQRFEARFSGNAYA